MTLNMLKLPSELTIIHVEVLHQDLLNELTQNNDICLDINDVVSADTASVQLLCALQKHLLTSAQKITWVGCSHALMESAELLGLANYLALNSNN